MRKFFLLFPLTLILFLSCSLNYGEQVDTQNSVPEFIFKNTSYKKYKDSKLSMEMNASIIEQYKTNSLSYADNAKFKTWNEDGELETEGSCALLSMDQTEKLYTMFKSIVIKNYSQSMEIQAENLKWNGQNEQLVSGVSDLVFLKKDKLELEGTGFSASGVSKSFEFTGKVTGSMDTSKSDEREAKDES